MALIHCRKCEALVSPGAERCPKCGATGPGDTRLKRLDDFWSRPARCDACGSTITLRTAFKVAVMP